MKNNNNNGNKKAKFEPKLIIHQGEEILKNKILSSEDMIYN